MTTATHTILEAGCTKCHEPMGPLLDAIAANPARIEANDYDRRCREAGAGALGLPVLLDGEDMRGSRVMVSIEGDEGRMVCYMGSACTCGSGEPARIIYAGRVAIGGG